VKIAHHLDEATVLALAAGTLNDAHAIVAATHIAMCPHCRATLKNAEAIGGSLLAETSSEAVSQNLRADTLAKLDAAPAAPASKPRAILKPGELPDVLVRALGQTSLDHVKWNRKLPGVAIYDVPLPKGTTTKLKLLSLDKGKAMPDHGHGGEELTLVLRGSYSDKMGRFAAGDVADLAEDVEHQPIVDSDENCICLISFDVPAKFKSIWARLAQPFAGM
jgi:putative transcriptional regulator